MEYIEQMFYNGVFESTEKGVVEIFPCKAPSMVVFGEVIHELQKTHIIKRVTRDWWRAYLKRGVDYDITRFGKHD